MGVLRGLSVKYSPIEKHLNVVFLLIDGGVGVCLGVLSLASLSTC